MAGGQLVRLGRFVTGASKGRMETSSRREPLVVLERRVWPGYLKRRGCYLENRTGLRLLGAWDDLYPST